ncbi:MAG: tRNA lysidine(34) synthetase TilS [Mycobacteriales bacterium]
MAVTRSAVASCLADLPSTALILVAASGGPDSMALAAATAFHRLRGRFLAGLVTVDHGLQPGSAQRAGVVGEWATNVGFEPVTVLRVSVARGARGPEAAARDARYQALDEFAARVAAAAVLLGHTSDDQAETVLIRLARGSGARSMSGMAAVRGRYRRPFLALPRRTTHAACDAQGLPVWSDPHNSDPAFTRSRVRHQLLPALVEVLGAGAVSGLATSAALLRDDVTALDLWASHALASPDALGVVSLEALPKAVRTRVLRLAALDAGAPAGSLGAKHLAAIDRLITNWHGQGAVSLPGGVLVERACGRLRFYVSDDRSPAPRRGDGAGGRSRHPATPG